MRLPRAVVRGLTRVVVRPLLSPRLPLGARRPLLDATGYIGPDPRGTRRSRADLGGVPTERVVVRGAHGPHQVLYVHGGGYQVGSPASHRALAAHLSRAAGAPVHLPDYRRAPEHPYPAPVDDVAAAYRALRRAGHPAQRIAVAGDSAGGGLVMALLLRLRAAGEEPPGSVGLISPWLDLDLSSPLLRANAATDAMLDPGWLADAAASYRRAADDEELRPLQADAGGLPPVHVVAGAEEILVGDSDALVERIRAAGGPVTYRRVERMWHAFPVFAGMLREADEAVADLGAAIRRDCGDRLPRVAVVGAGFGGIGMGMALRAAGWTGAAELTILDRAEGVGGVWRANTYPGAACDVPSHLYSFACAPGSEWSRRFAPQADILRYLQRLVREHGLTGHLRLGTEVTEARWDDAAGVWRLSLADGDALEADVLVPACGQLSRPVRPAIPGLDRFPGPVFHSAEWDHRVDLTGRRVAVIGTGASAIQFVPAIVDRVAGLTVFQRSAPHVIPKPDRGYRGRRRSRAGRAAARACWRAFFETGALGLTSVRAAALPFRLASDRLRRAQVADPALRARLAPDHPVGCKRILISSDWFPALTRPHVDVVTAPITQVTATGVRTADGGEHPADVIVLGTGFASTEFLAPMRVFGPGGRELSEEWRDGASAHLGITVPGFPNLFLLYGPNTNLGSGSIVHMLECQIGYVRQALELLRAGAGPLAVRPEVAERSDAELQQRLAHSVWTGCRSWYRTASGRVVNNWPGTMREYAKRTRTLDVSDYEVPLPATRTAVATPVHDQ
ncbi:alpha/beta hydrolase fold domain-containing protein [Pseudonocardia kunmingensis]|uniref:Cation diffusion facilitator CzcD-associated flavoprotein CzcO n=1 Tax=Pseudonocardia kunmingensis TaxID=630975 RepID=A0A543E1H8_9PSEU|nr:cation diffusion facilitator CzcD-associated flavoprotein CzcO [Pseudonocardia kunmingensis]